MRVIPCIASVSMQGCPIFGGTLEPVEEFFTLKLVLVGKGIYTQQIIRDDLTDVLDHRKGGLFIDGNFYANTPSTITLNDAKDIQVVTIGPEENHPWFFNYEPEL